MKSAAAQTKALDPVLIVDDEKDNLDALRRLLRNLYDVTVCESPFEALKLVQKQPFNVILSDQRMPEMTGVELLEKMKTLRPSATRILLTGYTDIESVIGAINRGNIYRYIAKPWDPEDLKITLRQANEAFLLREALDEKNRELEKTNSELKKALADLELLDRAKARFLSLVSHELNTPLTVIQSFVELLAQSKTSLAPEIQKAVASLEKASGRFSEIVGEVLTYIRLEADAKWNFKTIDAKALLDEIASEKRETLAKRHLTFKVVGGANQIRADEGKLRVALAKLIDNVASRASEKSEISVEISAGGRFKLEWKGNSIPAQAFAPLDFSGSVLHHGKDLGLSLATARLIIEGHSGEISSAQAGDRAVIEVKLPSQPLT